MIEFLPSRTVALSVLDFDVHWYGLLYLCGFITALILLPRLQRLRGLHLTRDEWLSILSYAVLGVIVGGRLGYVLFYEPAYFAHHPEKIIAVWEGGMSFHGGFLGVSIMLLLAAYRQNVSIAKIADIAAVPVAIGLAYGRFGNFINQELYGTVTSLPWGIAIPGVEGFRHPTQLYAIGKDLLIAIACLVHLRYAKPIPGRTFALFMILYGIGRFLIEYLRVQQYPLVYVWVFTLTRGQLLTVPLFLFGLLLWVWLRPEHE